MPNDLALALGKNPGSEYGDQDVEDAIATIRRTAQKSGLIAGIFCAGGESCRLEIKYVLFRFERQLSLSPGTAFYEYRLCHRAAAGKDLGLPDTCQRGLGIGDLSGKQRQPAHPAIAAAALILDLMPGAFQAIQ